MESRNEKETYKYFLSLCKKLARRKPNKEKRKWILEIKLSHTTNKLIKILLEMDEA